MVISRKAHAVYNMGSKKNKSYGVTIPMEFAREMGFDDGEKHFVMIRMVRNGEESEDEDYTRRRTRKKRTPYLIVQKIED